MWNETINRTCNGLSLFLLFGFPNKWKPFSPLFLTHGLPTKWAAQISLLQSQKKNPLGVHLSKSQTFPRLSWPFLSLSPFFFCHSYLPTEANPLSSSSNPFYSQGKGSLLRGLGQHSSGKSMCWWWRVGGKENRRWPRAGDDNVPGYSGSCMGQ